MDSLKLELKEKIIEQLNLEDLEIADIGDDEPLFGDGLALDSIDALELIVLLQQNYGIKLTRAEDGPAVFKSVNTMAAFIEENKK